MSADVEAKPIIVDGATVGELIQSDQKFAVRGLRDVWFPTAEAATQAVTERRQHTLELAEKHKAAASNVQVRMGRTLYDALVQNGQWVGRVVDETKTQSTVEVEQVDVLRAGLLELVASLEAGAKQNTRTERNSMRNRALIGAARQQLARL